MSSPIYQDEELDPALRYAPRWARDRANDEERATLVPPRAAKPAFSGDRAMVDLRRRLILNPDIVPEPVAQDARVLRPIALRLGAVIAVAAIVAWAFVMLPRLLTARAIIPADGAATGDAAAPTTAVADTPADGVTVVTPTRAGAVAPAAPAAVAPTNAVKLVEVHTAAAGAATDERFAMASPSAATSPPQAALPSVPAQPISSAPPPQPPPQSAAAEQHLDGAELAAMVKRGRDFLMSGDIASARLLLRRAAGSGSAAAALALGASFDPVVIRRLGAVGTAPDVEQARKWYQRAADLGSAEAMGQLAKLAQAQ